MLRILFISVLFMFFHTCEEEVTEPGNLPVDKMVITDQPVFFEYLYMNEAWGHRRQGWLIDQLGNVNYYNDPDEWHLVEGDSIPGDDLLFNLLQSDSIITTIDQDVLAEKSGLIGPASKGGITPLKNIANDAGSSFLYAYLYDFETQAYTQVFLARSGDFESHNTSEAAIALTGWLKQFGVFWLD